MPGYYNLTVSSSGGEGIYSYEDSIFIEIGEGTRSLDIALTKLSVTLSGTIQYESVPKSNISITFTPDQEAENNTEAQLAVATSDEQGTYVVEILPGQYVVEIYTTLT